MSEPRFIPPAPLQVWPACRTMANPVDAVESMRKALEPFAALLAPEGLEAVGGGTSIVPASITVQMVKDAQAALDKVKGGHS